VSGNPEDETVGTSTRSVYPSSWLQPGRYVDGLAHQVGDAFFLKTKRRRVCVRIDDARSVFIEDGRTKVRGPFDLVGAFEALDGAGYFDEHLVQDFTSGSWHPADLAAMVAPWFDSHETRMLVEFSVDGVEFSTKGDGRAGLTQPSEAVELALAEVSDDDGVMFVVRIGPSYLSYQTYSAEYLEEELDVETDEAAIELLRTTFGEPDATHAKNFRAV